MSAVNKAGKQTFILNSPVIISNWSSVAGKRESEGPLRSYFDYVTADNLLGEKTWEQAEQKFQRLALDILSKKAKLPLSEIDLILSGDLLNQCIGSSFTLKNMMIPHLGLYGACSTMAESLLVASMSVGGGFTNNAIAMSSSHFAASERQYRFPLGYGGQRTPTAQWTVTGAGAALIQNQGRGPRIKSCTIGTVIDQGVMDANNMGAAMAPAALSTLLAHFNDTGLSPADYDLIITGDLGQVGKELLLILAQNSGLEIGGRLTDCGTLVFDNEKQDVHSGGSGCGCSAITLCGYILDKLHSKKMKQVLFCGTGALLSTTSSQQGLSIPGVCHAIAIEGGN